MLRFSQKVARASGSSNPQVTGSITIAANEKIIVLLLKSRGATARTGGAPTLGGLTMTQANSAQGAAASPEAFAELWYYLDPPTGAKTISIPNSGAQTLFYTVVAVKASSSRNGSVYLHASGGDNNTSTNPTPGAVQLAEYYCFGIAITAGGWTTWNPSAQIGTILANTDDGADGGGEQYIEVVGPASHTLSWTFGTSDDWGAVVAYFAEKPAVAMQNYLFGDSNGLSSTEKIR